MTQHIHDQSAKTEEFLPRLVAWEVTRTCLLNCRHCRAAAGRAACDDEFTTAECFALLDNVASFAKPIIILTGGEPMLRPDIYDIASHAHALGMPVVMAPCGLLLNDATAGRIVQSGIRRISLSLDGATPRTHDAFRGFVGSFEGVMAGVEAAGRAGLDFQINTTVSRHNIDELEAILDLAVKLGASVFNPFLLVPTGRGRELLSLELSAQEYERTLQWLARQQSRTDIRIRVTCAPHYQRILRQCGGPAAQQASRGCISVSGKAQTIGCLGGTGFPACGPTSQPGKAVPPNLPGNRNAPASKGCMGGKSFAFISHVGKVQICGFLETECGDLRRENLDFRKIWLESEVLRDIRDVDSYKGRCGYCEFRKVCGGCRARAYATGGDYLAEEPYCIYQPRN